MMPLGTLGQAGLLMCGGTSRRQRSANICSSMDLERFNTRMRSHTSPRRSSTICSCSLEFGKGGLRFGQHQVGKSTLQTEHLSMWLLYFGCSLPIWIFSDGHPFTLLNIQTLKHASHHPCIHPSIHASVHSLSLSSARQSCIQIGTRTS